MAKNFTKIPDGYTSESYARELVAIGYRRVSNRHSMLSRVDRPDWVEHMAKEMRRAPADFIVRDGSGEVCGGWCDHYRRCYSDDVITVPEHVARLVKSSGHDKIGYVPIIGAE